MSKAKIVLVFAFLLVCAAGVVVGTAVDRRFRPMDMPPPPPHPFGIPDLTPAQESQMRHAWDAVANFRKEMFQTRHQLEDKRAESIQKILTAEQKKQYEQIQSDYHKQIHELDDQLASLVNSASEAMKSILTPEQYQKWMKTRKDHGFGHDGHPPMGPPGMGPEMGGPPGMDMGPGHHRGGHHSTTRPATEPAGAV